MKVSHIVCNVLVALAVSEAFGFDAQAEGRVFEALMNTTNLWNVCRATYHTEVSTNLLAVCRHGKVRAPRIAEEWFTVMLDLPLCTNDINNWSIWLNEKTFPVWTYGDIFTEDVASTNLWLRLADFIGEMRSCLKTPEELRSMAGSDRQMLFDLQTEMAARRMSEGSLKDIVLDGIGQRGIPLLPIDKRYSFFSNFVQRARLTPAETLQITSRLDAK